MSPIAFVFFKQKTAYEVRISDWSSDVCSSDLVTGLEAGDPPQARGAGGQPLPVGIHAAAQRGDEAEAGDDDILILHEPAPLINVYAYTAGACNDADGHLQDTAKRQSRGHDAQIIPPLRPAHRRSTRCCLPNALYQALHDVAASGADDAC